MMGWIADITAQGIRRPGYPRLRVDRGAGRATASSSSSLEEVTLDPVTVDRWEPLVVVALSALATGWIAESLSRSRAIPVPFSGETPGVEGEIAIAPTGDEPAPDRRGQDRDSLENEFLALPTSIFRACSATRGRYDPDERGRDAHRRSLPFSSSSADVLGPVLEARRHRLHRDPARPPWETDRYYVPLRCGGASRSCGVGEPRATAIDCSRSSLPARPAPAFQVEREAQEGDLAQRDRRAAAARPTSGSSSDRTRRARGPRRSRTPRVSSLVLAQARYWSRVPGAASVLHNLDVPAERRPHVGRCRPDPLRRRRTATSSRTRSSSRCTSSTRRARRGARTASSSPPIEPEFRWWFTSWIRPLEEAVAGGDLRRGPGLLAHHAAGGLSARLSDPADGRGLLPSASRRS